jgi:hypothetical protein
VSVANRRRLLEPSCDQRRPSPDNDLSDSEPLYSNHAGIVHPTVPAGPNLLSNRCRSLTSSDIETNAHKNGTLENAHHVPVWRQRPKSVASWHRTADKADLHLRPRVVCRSEMVPRRSSHDFRSATSDEVTRRPRHRLGRLSGFGGRGTSPHPSRGDRHEVKSKSLLEFLLSNAIDDDGLNVAV